MTPPLIDAELAEIERLWSAASPGPWTSWREGNQYVTGGELTASRCVAASRVEGIQRPWNPYRPMALALRPEEFEVARFTDADADAIARARTDVPRLVEEVRRLREVGVALSDALQRAGVALNEGDDLHEERCPCDDTCRCQIGGRIRAAVDAGLRVGFDEVSATQRCVACSHRHADPGGLGCAWCRCGHPVDCGCGGCVDSRADEFLENGGSGRTVGDSPSRANAAGGGHARQPAQAGGPSATSQSHGSHRVGALAVDTRAPSPRSLENDTQITHTEPTDAATTTERATTNHEEGR